MILTGYPPEDLLLRNDFLNESERVSKELENFLSSEDSFNKLTAAGYDYIKKNNLIDLLISKEIKIYQTL